MKKFIYTLSFLLISAAASVHAQTTNGSIEGSVTDPSGSALAGVSVTARNMDTGLTQATTTTQAGIYSLPNLPPGRYSVTVEAPNLKKFAQEGVTVTTGTAISLNIPMQLGAVSESVTVTADASQLQTTTSEIGATVSPTLIANLPLQVSGTIRNPVQFIELVPGFVGGVANDPGSNSSDDFKVNGGQEGGTDILVDGVSISLVSPNTQWNKGVSTDAVDEFRVLQSNFSAEYGQAGDGIVSLTIKSGTNELHGSGYDFLRNKSLDANSWANNLQGLKRPVDTQNDFGATIGGPVWIPKVYNGKTRPSSSLLTRDSGSGMVAPARIVSRTRIFARVTSPRFARLGSPMVSATTATPVITSRTRSTIPPRMWPSRATTWQTILISQPAK